MSNKFKVGDSVYHDSYGKQIFKITRLGFWDSYVYLDFPGFYGGCHISRLIKVPNSDFVKQKLGIK